MVLGRISYPAFSKVWPDLTELPVGKDSLHLGYKAMPEYLISTPMN